MSRKMNPCQNDKCHVCNGSGYERNKHWNPRDGGHYEWTCTNCDGTGVEKQESAWEMFRRLKDKDSLLLEIGFQRFFKLKTLSDMHFVAATLLLQYTEQDAIKIMQEIEKIIEKK